MRLQFNLHSKNGTFLLNHQGSASFLLDVVVRQFGGLILHGESEQKGEKFRHRVITFTEGNPSDPFRLDIKQPAKGSNYTSA